MTARSRSRSPRAHGEGEKTLEQQYAEALAEEEKELQRELQQGSASAGQVAIQVPNVQAAPVSQGHSVVAAAPAAMPGGVPVAPGMTMVPGMPAMPGAAPGMAAMPGMGMPGMGMPGMGMPGMAGMAPMPMQMGAMGGMGGMGGMCAMPQMMMPMGMGGMGMMPMMQMPMGMGMMAPMGAMGMGMPMPVAASDASLQDQESAFLKTASKTLQSAAVGQTVRTTTTSASSVDTGIAKTNPMHRAYQPPETEVVIGVTDKRFEGNIRMFLDDVGYGFIKSANFEKAWESTGRQKNDVFIHRYQKGPYKVGDKVTFSVYLNFKGKPQGTDLRDP
eukprot:TRINITY_DN3286_c0_g2_i1.p1 TRINITY_DN3286_c0_g2~~TRINITY_DN3286_c0_g2_i1.p1  ORF type:complete len:331 (-),score=76.86 TRINITY_DN3286_c0_g2_i1:108-1100(-)